MDFGALFEAFTHDAQWRHCMDTVQTWVRRRQHHGRCMGLGEASTPPTAPRSCEEAPNESSLGENDQLNRYVKLYLSIRNDVLGTKKERLKTCM